MKNHKRINQNNVTLLSAIMGGVLPGMLLLMPQQLPAKDTNPAASAAPIILDSESAKIEGTNARKEAASGDKPSSIGYWSNPDTVIHWTTKIPAAGQYDVWLYYSLDNQGNGTELSVNVGKHSIPVKLAHTDGWGDTQEIIIGSVDLDKCDDLSVSVSCVEKKGPFVANLTGLTLMPVTRAKGH
jgi:hypothetical protein